MSLPQLIGRKVESTPSIQTGEYCIGMASRPAALSASRTKEYLQCPLKFRYQVIDAIPEPPTEATVKGTVVHEALENLFDLPAEKRTPEDALGLLPDAWESTLSRSQEAAALFENSASLGKAKDDTRELVESYFRIEQPQNLEPKAREKFIDQRLNSGILLRGIVDRIDEAPGGALRVIDYKTGRAPSPRFVSDALFQMRFYALLLRESWRLPSRLQLLYLRSAQVLTLDPTDRDITVFEDELKAIWQRIKTDTLEGRFSTRKSKLCGWCSFQQMCPAFGGEELPIPEEGRARVLSIDKG